MNRDQYEKSCNFRRKGNRVEARNDHSWNVMYLGMDPRKVNPSINAAKRYIRKHELRSYTVK